MMVPPLNVVASAPFQNRVCSQSNLSFLFLHSHGEDFVSDNVTQFINLDDLYTFVGDCVICALLVEYHMQRFRYIGS
jgi:hypothetical protein